MADVKWIKLKVGMFDGMSFKKIKKAKIGGESFRDKLTAVWFELMDFAGKCNHDGAFISPKEIPFTELSDIATMIDRDEEELRLCMAFYINEGMVSVIDDIYMLSSWSDYQNTDGLEKIREKNRIRQARFKEKQKLLQGNVTDNVIVTQGNATEIEEEIDIETDIEKEKKKKRAKKPPKAPKENTHTLFDKLYLNYDFSEALIVKIREWITYKIERKDEYQEQGLKSLLTQIKKNCAKYGENAVCDLIDECMASNWKGIIFERLKGKEIQPQSSNKSYDTDEFFEAALRRSAKDLGVDKPQPKTAGEDEAIRKKAEDLKARLV